MRSEKDICPSRNIYVAANVSVLQRQFNLYGSCDFLKAYHKLLKIINTANYYFFLSNNDNFNQNIKINTIKKRKKRYKIFISRPLHCKEKKQQQKYCKLLFSMGSKVYNKIKHKYYYYYHYLGERSIEFGSKLKSYKPAITFFFFYQLRIKFNTMGQYNFVSMSSKYTHICYIGDLGSCTPYSRTSSLLPWEKIWY